VQVITTVTLPGGIVVRAGSRLEQPLAGQPDWGVYADPCWDAWPGIVLDWPDFGLPADEEESIKALIEAFARARGGQDVLVGCSGGTGRTGTILSCLAILSGVPAHLAVPWVRDRYRHRAVETQAQVGWVIDRFGQADHVRKEVARSRARLVKAAIDPIRQAMREALRQPERSPVLAWAVPGVLAVTQRPLRAHPIFGGSGHSYAAESLPVIEEWITRLGNHGIRSVVVLTSNKELAHYDEPAASEGGLLALYRARGLDVVHLPADDPAHDMTAQEAFEAAVDGIAAEVAEALRHVPLPAVIHCSAAIDRSPPVAARIAYLADVGALFYARPPTGQP
jgi:protein-tyrosine phosphatase